MVHGFESRCADGGGDTPFGPAGPTLTSSAAQSASTNEGPANEGPRQPPGGGRRRGGASGHPLLTLLVMALILMGTRYMLPHLVEDVRYAWRRGQLRAEYETSGEGLQNVSLDRLAEAYQMVAQRVGPSVVHIDVQRPMDARISQLAGAFLPLEGDQGSGVIVDPAGYIVTNHHVIQGGDEITVGLTDGRRVPAQRIGSDALTDLAVLKIEAQGLIAAEWGDSDASVVGTPVWALGSPFGLDRTVTSGILSGKHRAAQAGTRYQDFMQSDVAVNPGNSGGPLVDARGRLIGINTAIVGETYRGVSFSIPSNVARQVYLRLRAEGRVRRGWLGVALGEVPQGKEAKGDQPTSGALVTALADENSPAALAGIVSGDVIVEFAGQEVANPGALMRLVGDTIEGTKASVGVLRDGELQRIEIEIAARPERFSTP